MDICPQTFFAIYFGAVVILATIFSARNNNDNPIGERFVFWAFFPVGILILIMYKCVKWRKVRLFDMIISACGELFKF